MDSTFSSTPKLERILKSFEKKSPQLLASFHEQVDLIIKAPEEGKLLKGDLLGYYSWDFKLRGIAVRICYRYLKSDNHVILVYYGTRENFYDKVKKYVR
ncbi:MAG: type II toxin-antitoxin system RelE/ParE family toxin [Bacillota bacterium]